MMSGRVNDFLKGRPVVVLAGGTSEERDVSLLTGENVAEAYREMGIAHRILDLTYDNVDSVHKLKKEAGLVFVALHGGDGENGTIQSCLDFYNVPYTGSGKEASFVCKDKLLTKKVLSFENILTPRYVECRRFNSSREFIVRCSDELGFPLVLKINKTGSGMGVAIIKSIDELKVQLEAWSLNLADVFAEEYILGRELAVGLIEEKTVNKVLPILALDYDGMIFNYKVKYVDGYKTEIPMKVGKHIENRLIKEAETAFVALGLEGYGRLDVRLEEKTNKPYFLEATTLPGLTSKSWFPIMSMAGGYSFSRLIESITMAAIRRYETKDFCRKK